MFYRIAQLQLAPGKKTDSIDEIFVAEPDINREKLAGRLFVLLALQAKDSDYVKFANFLINELHHQYYQSEKMVLRERLSTIKIDHIFESALAKTNKNLANFVQNEKLHINASLVHATVGVIFENELHFTAVGGNRAFLIYKNTAAETGGLDYKISEVTQDEKAMPESIQKLFSSVVSGVIPDAGFFLFTNETLPEYLSTKQLADIISNLPPAGAMEQIKNQLEKINSYVPFLALLIKNAIGAKQLEYAQPPTRTASASLSSLRAAEETTEKLLTPSGVVDVRGWFSRLTSKLSFRTFLSSGLSGADNPLLKDKVFFKRRPNFKILLQIWQWFKYGLLATAHLLLSIVRSAITPNSWRKLFGWPAFALRSLVFGAYHWFRSLNFKFKILIAIALVAFAVFVINSFQINEKNQQTEIVKMRSELLSQINQKADQIEAAFIYGNEAGAKEILPSLKALLDQLPQTNEQEIAARDRLLEKYQGYAERLKHLVRLDRPAVLADFGTLAGETTNLYLLGKKLYAADRQNGNIYIYALADKTATSIPAVLTSLNYPTASGDNILYYAGDAVWQFNVKTDKINKLTLKAIGDMNGVKTMSVYNNKLYLLNGSDKQIYRFNRTPEGFVSPTSWLKPGVDITGAAGMFIDGNIYIIKSDGTAVKFLKGEPEPFQLEQPEPVFADAKKIMITEKQKYVYVTEPAQNRLVVFDKNGKFLKQYQLQNQGRLTDVTLDEANKKIYWLSGNKLLETPLEYF